MDNQKIVQTKICSIIAQAVSLLRVDPTFGPRLLHKWLPPTTWVAALKISHLIDPRFDMDENKCTRAMTSKWGACMGDFTVSNTRGVFRVKFGRDYFYYVTDPKTPVKYPAPLNKEWKESTLAVARDVLVVPTATRSQSNLADEETPNTRGGEETSKRQRTEEYPRVTPHLNLKQTTYWQSPEAIKLFRPNETDEDVKDTLCRRIKQLQSVNEKVEGWRNVMDGRDLNNCCTEKDIFEIRQRSEFLCCAYQLAVENMNGWTWSNCCKEALKILNPVGLTKAKNHATVLHWNQAFGLSENFPLPNPRVQCDKKTNAAGVSDVL